METGIELIARERERQIFKEGWSAKHDDGHGDGALARAGAVYATPEKLRQHKMIGDYTVQDHLWPFDEEWFKPTPEDRIRELVKAGALIAAEIDRLQRLKPPAVADRNPA